MKKLMICVSEWLSKGEDVVIALIISDSGSTPRGAGAKMAVKKGGEFIGTIGGGAVEYRAQQIAAVALENKKSQIESFTLSPNDKEDLGMICGGDVTVFFQYVSASDEKAKGLFAYGAELFEKNVDSWLMMDITDETGWRMEILTEEDKLKNLCGEKEREGRRYYTEHLTRAERVFVFGGGHISQELIPLLSHLSFNCVVFDNMPKFADKGLFPSAADVILGDFDNIKEYANITEKDYVVIVTRGHSHDFSVLAQALRRKPYYVGMIGSKKKNAAVFQKLREQGFSQDEIDRVHAPIGTAIKADTPAEIAVSIAGELIMTRAGSLATV